MDLVIKNNKDLTKEERFKCQSLSLRSEGEMCQMLAYALRREYWLSKVLMLMQDQKLLAWAHVFSFEDELPSAHFYVRRTHRRQGLATMLMQTLLNDLCIKTVGVYAWDDRSHAFFDKYIDTERADNVY